MSGIDVHCHLEYMENPDEVIKEARSKLSAIITSVADPKDAEQIMAIAKKNTDFVFVSLGFHPERMEKYSQKQIDEYMDFLRNNKEKIVAIGEVGLDYLWLKSEDKREGSRKIFAKFAELANETQLPLIIHCRSSEGADAMADTFKILEKADVPVVLHFFSGSSDDLNYALEKGYFISFTTMICKSKKYRKLAKKVPMNKMLLETDSPWLDPKNEKTHEVRQSPFDLTNRPWNIIESAKVIAEIKKISVDEILEQTENNARRVFDLK
ncbi:MAG: TatD family hydrolase [Candidatus Aenigmatarchaeota archaeon]